MDFKKKLNLSFKATLILTTLSTILLIFCFKRCFDATEGYFIKSIPPIIFSIIYILGIVFSLTSIFVFNKNYITKTKNEIGKTQIFYIAIATALALSVLACNLLSDNTFLMYGSIGLGTLIIYIMLSASKSGYNPSSIKIILIYASIIFPASMKLCNDTNYVRHINSVENVLTTVFGLSFMMYILYEAKRIHEGVHSRWHFATMLLTLHSGISLSLAYIFAYLTDSVNEPVRFLQMISVLLVSLFVGVELYRFINEADSKMQEEWDEIEKPEEEIDEEPEQPTIEE